MATVGGWNMQEAMLFIIQYIYTLVYAIVGFIAHNDLVLLQFFFKLVHSLDI
jgi:hypothetical protein